MVVGSSRHAPAALSPGKRPSIHYTRGWMGLRASLDECENSRLPGILTPERPARNESPYQTIL